MELSSRPLLHEDYDDILLGWWKDWKWSAPVREFLPDMGTSGIIVYADNAPICAGFLYATNSKVFWLEWIISDFKYKDRDIRKEAINFLIEELCKTAKNAGALFIYSIIKNPSLIATYEDLGFFRGDHGAQEMIKIV
jgi:GNAT superfamily N-acetyltransferase